MTPTAFPAPPAREPANLIPLIFAIAAATLPTLLARNVSPSPTFLNQAMAFGLWAAFVVAVAPGTQRLRAGAPEWVLLLLGLTVIGSWGPGTLPSSLALSALGTLAAAAVLLQAGRAASRAANGGDHFVLFCWGWLVAGLANVGVALVQVFAPGWADGQWVAVSGLVGRAVGNLRQPNHLSSLLMWGSIAVVVLVELKRLPRAIGALALVAIVFSVVLTASRTGLVSVLLLALWGLLDRQALRPTRVMLMAAPLVYAIGWWLMSRWAVATEKAFGGAARLAETDISSSRFAIWADTLALSRDHPWLGVGWGQFNLAWTLTPSPDRPTAFFDHAHNLPLHLAVELGLPLALLVMLLLIGSFGSAAWRAWRTQGDEGVARRGAVMLVLMIGLHSLLEYPLWYSYFLLPAAWALGVALRPLPDETLATQPVGTRTSASWWLTALALLLMAGAVFSIWDYRRVVEVFHGSPGAPPLLQRVETGQRSVFFSHHADYAAATSKIPVADPAAAFARASHFLLDTRFMIAWANERAAAGDDPAARHLAARIREFRRAEAGAFLAPCAIPASAAVAFQCQPAGPPLPWRHFAPLAP